MQWLNYELEPFDRSSEFQGETALGMSCSDRSRISIESRAVGMLSHSVLGFLRSFQKEKVGSIQ